MSKFKVPEDNGDERQTSTVSISPFGLNKFNQIKRSMGFRTNKTITSQEVLDELINTWLEYKRKELLESDTN